MQSKTYFLLVWWNKCGTSIAISSHPYTILFIAVPKLKRLFVYVMFFYTKIDNFVMLQHINIGLRLLFGTKH